MGIQQSRRDDMEGLGYVLLYFRRCLPWQGKKTVDKISKKKLNTTVDVLCKGQPAEFAIFWGGEGDRNFFFSKKKYFFSKFFHPPPPQVYELLPQSPFRRSS